MAQSRKRPLAPAWRTIAALVLLGAGYAARAETDAFLQRIADARFQYGEAWWWEPQDDETTSLLLRFGPPTERAVDRDIPVDRSLSLQYGVIKEGVTDADD